MLGAIFILPSCKHQPVDYSLNDLVAVYFKDSLSIKGLLGSEVKIIDRKISNGKLLLISKDTETKLVVVDLVNKKVDFSIADPFPFGNSSFDVTDDSMYVVCNLYTDVLWRISMKTKSKDSVSMAFKNRMTHGEALVNHKQLFLYKTVYGIALIDLTDLRKVVFRNSGASLIDPKSSDLSLPVDDKINLLSGHNLGKDITSLYAIDNEDSIRWKYSFERRNDESRISILNFPDKFLVKYDSTIVCLNKQGEELWSRSTTESIREIYRHDNKVLTYGLVNSTGFYPDSDRTEYRIYLKLFDLLNGILLWTYEENIINEPSISIQNDCLLIADKESFRVVSLKDGELQKFQPIPKGEKSHFSYTMLMDTKTGKYYLSSYDDTIYW